MNKLAACATLALLTLGLAEARAQIIFTRPGSGRFNQFGVPFGGPFGSPFGGMWGGGTYSPPVTPSPNSPGYQPGVTGRTTTSRSATDDPNAGNVTGHGTRFLSYSHYFMNQGGGASGAPLVNPQQQQGARPPGFGLFIGGDYARSPAGLAPTRPIRTPSGGGRR